MQEDRLILRAQFFADQGSGLSFHLYQLWNGCEVILAVMTSRQMKVRQEYEHDDLTVAG